MGRRAGTDDPPRTVSALRTGNAAAGMQSSSILNFPMVRRRPASTERCAGPAAPSLGPAEGATRAPRSGRSPGARPGPGRGCAQAAAVSAASRAATIRAPSSAVMTSGGEKMTFDPEMRNITPAA